MSFLKNMPMKYRLLIVVFLPAIFLIWSVWTDYKVIQQEAKVQTLMVYAQKVSSLADNLEAVSGFSKIHLNAKEGAVDKDLVEYRGKVESGISELKELAAKAAATSEGADLKNALQPLFTKNESMRQINSQVDSRSISYAELDAFYDGYVDASIGVLHSFADQAAGGTSTRVLFEVMALMEQRLYAGAERNTLYQAFKEDKISSEQYISFLQIVGMQDAFRKEFRDIATEQDDQIYDSTVRGDIVAEVDKLRKVAIAKGTAGRFGINPKEWWLKQTAKMNQLQEVENKIIAAANENLRNLQQEHQFGLIVRIVTVVSTLFISFMLIFLNLRSLALKLQEEINVLAISGEEIGKSITETASGTSETATAVAETTTTVEELKQTAQVATEKAKNVAEVSDEALKTLKRSETSVEATIQGMNSIQEGMGLISDSIVKLSEHSQMIREIIDTVNDLAEQSHILAVNAAIESAKAGDQGKGFAVVAQEVRSLAEQSKQATVQVRNILNDIQNATSSAVMATEKGSKAVANGLAQSVETNESIRFLSLGINKVAQAASQISLSSQQQLVGVDQLTIAMSNIKTASNQQVNNMAQIETGIHGLNTVGQSLKQVIHECKM